MTRIDGTLRTWSQYARLAAKLLLASLGALSAWLAAAIVLEVVGAREPPSRAERPTWDAIVVLGCRVSRDGAPSLAMRRRVGYAVELFQQGRAPRIVMTGGRGEDEPVSEASVAAKVAEALGVPREAILIEEESQSTEQNAEYARRALGPGEVLVVSDAYHVTRGARVFGRYFDEVDGTGIRGAPLGGALREVAAIAIYALLGRLDGPVPVPVDERLAKFAVATGAARRGATQRGASRNRRAARATSRPSLRRSVSTRGSTAAPVSSKALPAVASGTASGTTQPRSARTMKSRVLTDCMLCIPPDVPMRPTGLSVR